MKCPGATHHTHTRSICCMPCMTLETNSEHGKDLLGDVAGTTTLSGRNWMCLWAPGRTPAGGGTESLCCIRRVPRQGISCGGPCRGIGHLSGFLEPQLVCNAQERLGFSTQLAAKPCQLRRATGSPGPGGHDGQRVHVPMSHLPLRHPGVSHEECLHSLGLLSR